MQQQEKKCKICLFVDRQTDTLTLITSLPESEADHCSRLAENEKADDDDDDRREERKEKERLLRTFCGAYLLFSCQAAMELPQGRFLFLPSPSSSRRNSSWRK